ncbi:hypothetical protein Tco_0907150 [Tanacetum coccineum]|uniref:Uncharacterized protein n=1 Tax=Tanacetum coccineum TaxID=301880 RepID=A0ABQ5CJF6_9ASTR
MTGAITGGGDVNSLMTWINIPTPVCHYAEATSPCSLSLFRARLLVSTLCLILNHVVDERFMDHFPLIVSSQVKEGPLVES